MFLKRSLLIIVGRCLSITMFADICTTFSGILFIPVAFLVSKRLVILFIWSTVAALIFSFTVAGNSFFILILICRLHFCYLAEVPNFVGCF